ncbi:unnamed protein product [Peronospora belbahrii]|uniref:DUF4604 domain-containing protein n=1 Tax=Peronospora belbahrii TaxID=622444 RepID=A0ABN8CPS0_9STRA|nr:unnamed protein product [Peronospora belbahrii]
MDDDWREDGSLRGLNAGNGQGKARSSKGKGPQFTRVIPKFLQKYHQPPAIQAKFAVLPNAGEEEEDEGLDEVQQAAIDEYLTKRKDEKKETDEGIGLYENEDREKKKKQGKVSSGQNVVEMGKTVAPDAMRKKKRKRMDRATLSNKKLLSFSMDDE